MNFLALIPLRNWIIIGTHGILIVIIGYFAIQSNMYKSSAEDAAKTVVKAQYNEAVHAANEAKLVDELNKQNNALIALKTQQDEAQLLAELQIKAAQDEAVTAKQKSDAILKKRAKSSATACVDASTLFEDNIYAK